ncbi:MAG: hypothetical protein M1823_001931 [Watsoniomyces obsoletus]|nr:MAG: hypothetical protein M1823_001931 [Watsoniomyces obsoletus]
MRLDEVAQPCGMDYLGTLECHADLIKVTEAKIKEITTNIDSGMDCRIARQGLRKQQQQQQELGTYKELRDNVLRFDRRFGRVLASSGYRTSPENCLLDWGLVLVDETRAGSNLIRSTAQVMNDGALRHLLNDTVTKTGRPELHDRVLMTGSTSETRGGNFVDFGDSGAAVINSAGELVGMIIGGPMMENRMALPGEFRDISTGEAIMTPIEEILKDVSRRLGRDACLPPSEEEISSDDM